MGLSNGVDDCRVRKSKTLFVGRFELREVCEECWTRDPNQFFVQRRQLFWREKPREVTFPLLWCDPGQQVWDSFCVWWQLLPSTAPGCCPVKGAAIRCLYYTILSRQGAVLMFHVTPDTQLILSKHPLFPGLSPTLQEHTALFKPPLIPYLAMDQCKTVEELTVFLERKNEALTVGASIASQGQY